jgi:hypothetical protein
LSLTFRIDDRFHEAAEEWGEKRMMETEKATETKVEQALLEIEHLVSGAYEVEFDVEGREVSYDPSEELSAFLARQAGESGLSESEVLQLHVSLFARVFLDDEERPPNAPPT